MVQQLTSTGRYLVLAAAFFGWLLAGMQLSISFLGTGPAVTDVLDLTSLAGGQLSDTDDTLVNTWYARVVGAFLAGAAAGGLLFGWIGDRIGRTKALALAILCYSVMSGFTYFAQEPWQLALLRFAAGLGVGGTWPNGVALVSEAWSNLSRPMLAGVMGTSANVGILCFSLLAKEIAITPDAWQWIMLVGSAPALLGLFTFLAVPESPRWLAVHVERGAGDQLIKAPTGEVFRMPLLRTTLLGIGLAAVPLMGGWGSSTWIMRWADQVRQTSTADATADGEDAETVQGKVDHKLKARISIARSLTGVVGSLLGGWFGSLFGRRGCYLLTSLCALASAQYMFWVLSPSDSSFLLWCAVLGFFSGIYFGWLPLFLPELFVTRVRSTGSGVCFNFGRILSVVTLFTTGELIRAFGSDYPLIGKITSLIYLVGVLLALCIQDTSRELED